MGREHTDLKADVRKALEEMGALVVSFPSNAMTGEGTSDLLVCLCGLFLGVEIKTPGDDLSPSQRRFRKRVERAGGLFVEARSIEQVVREVATWLHEKGEPRLLR
jgi:hypothetical protein